MKTLRKCNALAFVVILVLVSGCATHRATNLAGTDVTQTRMDSAPNTSPEEFIGPEDSLKHLGRNDTHWWEYALMPVTVGSGLLLWYGNLPGIAR